MYCIHLTRVEEDVTLATAQTFVIQEDLFT